MILFTNDKKEYRINWLEYWNENERFFLAETTDGEGIKIDEDNFNRVESEAE